MQTTAKPKEHQKFSELVETVDDGRLDADLSEQLALLISKLNHEAEECSGTAKGSITLKLDLKLDAIGVMKLGYTLAVKQPKPVRPEATLWMREDGTMATEHPRQQMLPAVDPRPGASVVVMDPSRKNGNNSN